MTRTPMPTADLRASTDSNGDKHWSWTAVKDGMAFDFSSDDTVRPDYRVEQWCRATDATPQILRERILGVMSRVDQTVASRNKSGKVLQFDWGEQKKGTVHGFLQRVSGGQKTNLVLTYHITRIEADELPVESRRIDLEIPAPVLTLLR
jgi:hypothetical protein